MSREKLIFVLVAVVAVSLFAAFFVYQPLWSSYSDFRPWRLGLDLAGGAFLTYEIDLSGVEDSDRESVVEGLRSVIERRVNIFGVSEPEIYVQETDDGYRLGVELAGINNIDEAIEEIGETPLLDFREVREIKEETLESSTSSAVVVRGQYQFIPTALTGRYLNRARVGFDSITGQPRILLEFNDEGAKIFEEITARNIGEPLCIFLDNEIRSFSDDCPIIQGKISGGRAEITGRFTLEEVKTIVQRFNAGALPAPIILISQHTVSADLGQDSLDKIIKAGALGFMAVILYMVIYYRRLGIFAALALLMYLALLLAVFKIIPITLTLAGIAGVVLSIGMAVDANILIFERTKEELKAGLVYAEAIEIGFKRAWTSIRDANITTIISSVILYYFTTSFVKGFALALLIGVLVSMFSAIVITRTLLRVFVLKSEIRSTKSETNSK